MAHDAAPDIKAGDQRAGDVTPTGDPTGDPAGDPAEIGASDIRTVDDILDRLGRQPGILIPALVDIQEHFGYLPLRALEHVACVTGLSPAQVTGVSTFYPWFRFRPVGKHHIRVCEGTACFVAGAAHITNGLKRHMGIEGDEDTDLAQQVTVEPVECLGCCSLAPCMVLDSQTVARLTSREALDLLIDLLARDER